MPQFDIAEIRWIGGIRLIRHSVHADNVIYAVERIPLSDGPSVLICGGYVKSRGQVWVDRDVTVPPTNVFVDIDDDGVHVQLTNAVLPQGPTHTLTYEYDPQADDYRLTFASDSVRTWRPAERTRHENGGRRPCPRGSTSTS